MPHVLIIGGGIGGLCLAQGLSKAGITVTVCERGASAAFRGQGTRISLKEAGGHALRACLPANLFDLCVATSIASAGRLVVMDQLLNQAFAIPLPAPDPALAFGVNRLTLREILLCGLEDVVFFGKTFTHFEQVDGKQVRAHFADGDSVTADLLVGADGTDSATRAQLVPDAEIEDLNWSIWGKTPIRPGTLDWVPDELFETFNRVNGPDGLGMSVATCRARRPVAGAVAEFAPGARVTDVPGYFSWTINLAGIPHDTGAAALHRLASDLIEDWHPALRRILAEAEVGATFPVRVRSALPIRPWSSATVTLLGDAVHTMSPSRGEGANTALRDAEVLCGKLIGVAAGEVTLEEAKAEYEAEMLRYGFGAVAESRTNPLLRMRG